MIDLVVFDMAGTTVRDGGAVRESFRAALLAAAVDVSPAAVRKVMGQAKPVAIRRLLDQARGRASDAEVAAVHADFVRRMQRYYAADPSVAEVPGAAETFARLRAAGVRVALNTGFSRPIVEPLLVRLGWSVPATVDAVVTSDEVARGRPAPDMLRLLMERFGIRDSTRVAKVGDTVVDLEEGHAAGCGLVIGVLTGACTREELAPVPHTHLVASIVDVPGLILGP